LLRAMRRDCKTHGQMDFNSPLFDRIRASRKKEEEPRPQTAACDHPGCREPGLHRAPKGRQREGQYWRFCLEHVRAYNQSYNYFNGMDDDAVASHQKADQVGHRPTWKMGVKGSAGMRSKIDTSGRVADPFNLFRSAAAQRNPATAPRVGLAARKALETLGLDENADAAAIKTRYKLLVKRFHPDANGGDRSFEARFQEIIKAHGVLRAQGLC